MNFTFDDLLRIRSLRLAIESNLSYLAELRSRAQGHTSILSGLPSSASSFQSFLELYTIRASEIERIVDDQLASLADLQLQALHEIDRRVSDPDSRSVLRLRYIDCLPWKSIFATLHFSRAKTFRLHRTAIRSFNKETSSALV